MQMFELYNSIRQIEIDLVCRFVAAGCFILNPIKITSIELICCHCYVWWTQKIRNLQIRNSIDTIHPFLDPNNGLVQLSFYKNIVNQPLAPGWSNDTGRDIRSREPSCLSPICHSNSERKRSVFNFLKRKNPGRDGYGVGTTVSFWRNSSV